MFSFQNISLWIHILSAITWVGGVFYTWWVVVPGFKQAYPAEEAIPKVVELEKNFRRIAHIIIVLVATTGVLNLLNHESIAKFKSVPEFGYFVAGKLLLLTLMIFAHSLRHGVYSKQILVNTVGGKLSNAGWKIWKKSQLLLIIQAIAGALLVFLGVNLSHVS